MHIINEILYLGGTCNIFIVVSKNAVNFNVQHDTYKYQPASSKVLKKMK